MRFDRGTSADPAGRHPARAATALPAAASLRAPRGKPRVGRRRARAQLLNPVRYRLGHVPGPEPRGRGVLGADRRVVKTRGETLVELFAARHAGELAAAAGATASYPGSLRASRENRLGRVRFPRAASPFPGRRAVDSKPLHAWHADCCLMAPAAGDDLDMTPGPSSPHAPHAPRRVVPPGLALAAGRPPVAPRLPLSRSTEAADV